jgi:hypothetical protein
MKKLFLLSLIHFVFLGYSQTNPRDILILKNDDRLIGEIIEDHYPEYLLFRSEVLGIKKIQYNQINKINSYKATLPKEEVVHKKKEHEKRKYFSIGTGLGYSYGGIGAKLQHHMIRKTAWGFLLGVGYNEYTVIPDNYEPKYQDSGVALSFGVKFYPYKWFYLNINYLFNIDGISERELQNISDLSLLLGVDYLVFKNWGINAGFGVSSYNDNFIINFDQTDVVDLNQLALDFGVYYKFKTKK